MLLLALAAVCLGTAVYLVGIAPRRTLHASLGRAAAYGRPVEVEERPQRELPPGAAALASLALRLSPRSSRASAAAALQAAGVRVPVDLYLAFRSALALAGAVVGAAAAGAAGAVAPALLLALLLGAVGFLLPASILNAKARTRRETMLAALPNALDLLAVSVEAGLGLDGAIARYAETAHGPLAEELGRIVAELRVGASRQEVLRRLTERVPAPETAAFVRAVVHADQLGASLTGTLRAQAGDTRQRRQARAEEIANRAPVKMLFPTVFFVFPALFVVVLGPALLYLAHAFR